VVILLFVLGAVASAQSTTSRCAECHFANMSSVPAPQHLGDWQQSAHGKSDVGCDKCHGGDPTTFQPAEAHRGVLNSDNPASPVHRANLARTCVSCHARNAAAFAQTVHQSLVQAGDLRAPTCVSCHGVMSARVPSPSALEQRCATCHPAGSARGAYPGVVRAAVEALDVQRRRADELEKAILGVSEHTRRVALLASLFDARGALKEAIAGVHNFDIRAMHEHVDMARRRLDLTTSALTPPPR
jgi:nitrate/TMAO reductase-like tetraheme cytochrome c subunit